jgi:hypothetical protein
MTAPTPAPAPTERGWGKLLLAIAAFIFVPMIPQFRAFLPIEQTMLLFVPAVAACALVGWWAGGRAFVAIAWVGIAVLLTLQPPAPLTPFYNLARGWSLLLAGAFGLVCLFGARRPVLSRALSALAIALGFALVMSFLGPVTTAVATKTVRTEFERRNAETMTTLGDFITAHPKEWQDLSTRLPQIKSLPDETAKQLEQFSTAGIAVFPALLALESLAALALGWATYHRLGRTRLGLPLGKLREFRFNDQFVWGLIAGLTIVLLPTLTTLTGIGRNLLVFFGALYAVRGLGVLSWFMAPGTLAVTLVIGFVMLFLPFLSAVAVLAFMALAVAAIGLGLGDTWADWRNRARSTS